MSRTLSVAAVEDDVRYRRSLQELIARIPELELEGVYGSAELFLAKLGDDDGAGCPWDLVLMDLELPGTSGVEAIRRLKESVPGVKVIVLTVFEEPETVLEAICAGADGYLVKRRAGRDLARELRSVTRGGAPLTSGVARTVVKLLQTHVERARDRGASPPSRLGLTDREQDVLRELARGRSYQQTATELGIALETVRSHVRSLYDKLQVHSVAEAVSRAIRERLI